MSFQQISYNLSENGHGHFTKETSDICQNIHYLRLYLFKKIKNSYNVFTLGTVCNVVS